MNPHETGTRKLIATAPITFFACGLLLGAARVAHAETVQCPVPAQWSDLIANPDALPKGSSPPNGEHAAVTLLGYRPQSSLAQAVLSHWLAQMKEGNLACTLAAPSGSPYRLFSDLTLKISSTEGRVLDGFAILAHKLSLLDTFANFENLRPVTALERSRIDLKNAESKAPATDLSEENSTQGSRQRRSRVFEVDSPHASKPPGAVLPLPVRSGLLARLLLDDTLKRTSGPGTTQPAVKREPTDLMKGDRTTAASAPSQRPGLADDPPSRPVPLNTIERIERLADTAPIERLVRGQISADELIEVFLKLNTADERGAQKSKPAVRQSTVDLLDVYNLLKTAFVTNTLSSPYQKRLIFGLEASESSPHLTFSSPHVASFETRLLDALAKEASEKPQVSPHPGEKTGHP